jgi:hypothetical protein
MWLGAALAHMKGYTGISIGVVDAATPSGLQQLPSS